MEGKNDANNANGSEESETKETDQRVSGERRVLPRLRVSPRIGSGMPGGAVLGVHQAAAEDEKAEAVVSAAAPTRPALRYHGGKWRLAPWIIANMPPHRIYVEPFGGAGSVLLRKPRVYAEVYNDLEGEVVNLFKVLRDRPEDLKRLLELTPYARDEYRAAFEMTDDPVELARRMLVRSYMGFGSNSVNRVVNSGFRANSTRSATTPAHDWCNFPPTVAVIARRLRGVTIENRPALEIIEQQDNEETLFYCDPPYTHSTRTYAAGSGARSGYILEMSDEDHCELAMALYNVSGMVMISGYRSELYDALYGDWKRLDKEALADGARKRTESLWLNPAAEQATARKGDLPCSF